MLFLERKLWTETENKKGKNRKNYTEIYCNNPGIKYKLSQVGAGKKEIGCLDLKAMIEIDTLKIAVLLNGGVKEK